MEVAKLELVLQVWAGFLIGWGNGSVSIEGNLMDAVRMGTGTEWSVPMGGDHKD